MTAKPSLVAFLLARIYEDIDAVPSSTPLFIHTSDFPEQFKVGFPS